MKEDYLDLICADRMEELGFVEAATALRRSYGKPKKIDRIPRKPDVQAVQNSFVLIGGSADGQRVFNNEQRLLMHVPPTTPMFMVSMEDMRTRERDYRTEEYTRHSFSGAGYRFDYFSAYGMDGNDVIHRLLTRYPEPEDPHWPGRKRRREEAGSYR